ncbi:hypothetical protein A0128_14850 [Leptospira tipperaryensis]|uniref:Uncharacterized protein n=1 Tax=Leptospira tipperaryensis TaxID=2564040 RepID=A0A1D7UZK8_9LEPT|nr:hypothetical protein [Leptospira tipperaryensis]AOP35013.1 hypothetical protein A0128_14850 [Leptospira tipperaryensis]
MTKDNKKKSRLILVFVYFFLIVFTCKFDRWVANDKTILFLPGLYCFYNFDKFTIKESSTSALCPDIKDFAYEPEYHMFYFEPAESAWIFFPKIHALDKKKIIAYGLSPVFAVIFFLLAYFSWAKFIDRK